MAPTVDARRVSSTPPRASLSSSQPTGNRALSRPNPDRFATHTLVELTGMLEDAQRQRRRMDAFSRNRGASARVEEYARMTRAELAEHRAKLLDLLNDLRAEMRRRAEQRPPV